ncbi:MAG: hypothetical protein E7143_08645 [Rikenellaceae bacterium]|nr:hypothetical protein [Rikenellaceae bacterium]
MKRLLLIVLSITVSYTAMARQTLCDDNCKVEFTGSDTTEPRFAVVSPVGMPTVEKITQAPRLTTLEGKTIAIVGQSFMTEIIHPEIARLIAEHYPTAKVVTTEQVGMAGVYPAPGIRRRSKEEFQAKLKEYGVDAVITGNCGCGLCTQKECGSAIAAEYIGIPAVAIAAPTFVEQVYYTATNNGIAAPRVAEYPGAFALHTTEELIANTRNILWDRIVSALTTPITEDELNRHKVDTTKGITDDVYYGTTEQITGHFEQMKWTDGLPFNLPTYERVMRFIEHTDYTVEQTVTVLPIAHRNTTAWHIAVNGVMADCKPEYMPLLIAITEALGAPEFRRTLASTHGWTPYCWINGPIVKQLGIATGQGGINSTANMAIARFINLALINLAGYYVGDNRMGTFGYPMPWVLAEDEASCEKIGWQPYHIRAGFDKNQSVVTLCSALTWGGNMAPATTDAQRIMELMAWDITERGQFALGSGKQYTHRTILLTPSVAATLATKYSTPELLEADLIKTARRPTSERVFANYYANPGSNPEQRRTLNQWQWHITNSEDSQLTPPPVWHATSDSKIATIPTMKQGMTAILITGDESRNKVQIMPGGGFVSRAVR